MTFRTSKKHKAQESTKTSKNALKLASRFQRFLKTGVASKKDLKDLDERFNSQLSQQGDRVLTLLDQLREFAAKNGGLDLVNQSCELWAKWLASLDSKENLGFSNLKIADGATDDTHGILLEGVIDAETNLFQMLFAYKSMLSSTIRNAGSIDEMARTSIFECAKEIIDTFQSRQRLLSKIINSQR